MAYFQGLWLLVSGSVFFQNLFDTLKSMLYPLSPPRIHGIHATVDGRNPAPVEVGSLFLYLRRGFIHPRWLFGIS